LQVQNNFLSGLGDLLVNITVLTALDLGYNTFCSLSTALEAWATANDPDWKSTQNCEEP
jgi:hypothetical protein